MLPVLWLALATLLLMGIGSGSADAQTEPAGAAREKWQRLSDLIGAMAVGEGSVVADVGAGNGFLTVRLADAVRARGRVYAVDIAPEVLQRLRDRVSKARLTNVEVIEGTPSGPRLPITPAGGQNAPYSLVVATTR